jgi:5-oxopent-3-ene-1,2,5-tricarboxylate decarboxylase/2-hydroxyhepta-2,4-diene-1,7-dioate isomerase
MEIEGLGALENPIEWETEEAEPIISQEGDRSFVL